MLAFTFINISHGAFLKKKGFKFISVFFGLYRDDKVSDEKTGSPFVSIVASRSVKRKETERKKKTSQYVDSRSKKSSKLDWDVHRATKSLLHRQSQSRSEQQRGQYKTVNGLASSPVAWEQRRDYFYRARPAGGCCLLGLAERAAGRPGGFTSGSESDAARGGGTGGGSAWAWQPDASVQKGRA